MRPMQEFEIRVPWSVPDSLATEFEAGKLWLSS